MVEVSPWLDKLRYLLFPIYIWLKPYRITLVNRDGTIEERRFSSFERNLRPEFGGAVFLVACTKWFPRREYSVYRRGSSMEVHDGFTDRDAAVMFARFLPLPKQETTMS